MKLHTFDPAEHRVIAANGLVGLGPSGVHDLHVIPTATREHTDPGVSGESDNAFRVLGGSGDRRVGVRLALGAGGRVQTGDGPQDEGRAALAGEGPTAGVVETRATPGHPLIDGANPGRSRQVQGPEPSDLTLDAFLLARDIRELDMRAAPYDLRPLGYEPVRIETADGKREYAEAQRAFTRRSNALRLRLLAVLHGLVAH